MPMETVGPLHYFVDQSGCHIWQRACNNRGYGVVWFDGKLRLAHRVAWFLENGRWPDPSLVLDHGCDVKCCVNAAHLREMENWRNLRRAVPRGTPEVEHQRLLWRAASQRRRNYSLNYVLGGE